MPQILTVGRSHVFGCSDSGTKLQIDILNFYWNGAISVSKPTLEFSEADLEADGGPRAQGLHQGTALKAPQLERGAPFE
jgi:hypothetical protein